MLFKAISGCWFYFWGHIFSIFYDRKYIKGKWFKGRFGGICATGWRWVTKDIMARFFGGAKGSFARYPVGENCFIICPENIEFHPDDLNNFHSFGTYFQAFGKIKIGKGTYIAPNVGIITSNHSFDNLDNHETPKEVTIGEGCWIGMNSVILPGVILGNKTIVGAGSVVTKSFEKGNCVIAGNPAKLIKTLDEKEQ